jgi:F0F1-type ATP synthase membrane subunit b/b'
VFSVNDIVVSDTPLLRLHPQEVKTAELERKFIEQNTKMKKEYEQKLEELKKACEEDINERLDASVKRILQQNRRMAEELRLHVQETDELQREKKV